MIENSLNTLKQRLLSLRKAKEMSQTDVANKLGIAFRTYQNYENEKNSIPHDIVVKLSQLHKVSLNFILLGENDLLKTENLLLDIKNNTFVETRLENGFLVTIVRAPLSQFLVK